MKRAIQQLLERWTELDVRDYVHGPDTEIRPGDTVLLYGRESSLDELGYRPHGPAGDAEHEQGITRHEHARAAEQARDRHAQAERGASNE